MTNSIKRFLKELSKLNKCYYKNEQKKIDHEKLLEKSFDFTKEIMEAAKMYWAILSRLLYKKKFQQYQLCLLMVNLYLIFLK